MNHFFKALIAICIGISSITAQELEKTWHFTNIENSETNEFLPISNSDVLTFSDGDFSYKLHNIDSLKASGHYIFQNNLLVFYYNTPKDTIRKYKIREFTDSTLVFTEKSTTYSLESVENENETIASTATDQNTEDVIKPSQGFSFSSLWRGVLGMFTLIVIAFLFSSNRKAINWKTVGIGLAFQLLIAIGVLKVGFVKTSFEWVGSLFVSVLDFTRAGSEFLFDGLVVDMDTFGFIFAFQVLPTILFFSALTSVLFYLGVIQKVVKAFGWLLTKLLKISGAESLSVAGNIFLGQTEAPLLIKAYLEKMNKSEILLVMIGGMATVAGAVLAAYIGFLGGDDPELRLEYAKHLLAASVMAAPGAIVISKILFPQTENINTDVKVSQEKIGANILDAIANGTTEGLRLAVNVGAMLLVFVAFIAMINGILGWAGEITTLNNWMADNTPYQSFSLEAILGTIFAPLMWLIGVAKEDMMMMGQLLGIKLAASEFVGYIQLADLKDIANATHLNYNKSVIMATYMLCGFANFASIGIQIGGIGSLAPGQRKQLSKFGMKALIGGTIASLISATIAGMIIG
ncbi:nucleoside transporter C-terminal domain-containing protein [Winogradskyella marincola]|uniref:Nucleoside transporter C-terminal domain-containing protein n=1 Tax=Winogradskyella marincola TaxID=3037795 RepID=A0ABT6G1F1_9FLAO|nr:nucleoside transporter C-terminal domain-containing protein [Winogradskyella sp. YYF002]MDG4715846.1 nucleoside transporter C-terminal domain-containing protein [Winogradskyella sp. YYF002]